MWEETVMDDVYILERATDLQIMGLGTNDDVIKALKEHLLAQAEITGDIAYKAGYDARLEDAREAVKIYIEDIKKAGEEQGIQKILEFLKKHRHQELLVGAHRFVFTESEWQAFLESIKQGGEKWIGHT